MKSLTIALFFALLVLHQDFWAWNDDGVVMGFMPAGLAYHAVFSILCAALGWMAIQYWWPHREEKHSEGTDEV